MNYLSVLEFKLLIKRLPNVEFTVQRVNIPGISSQPVAYPTQLNTLYELPDKLTYSDLIVSFIIDENMNNYLEVFSWMHGITFPQSFTQYKNLKSSKEGLRSDISIILYNSSKNAQFRIDYLDCFPTSLSEISLDTTSTDVQYPEATVTFQYNSYSINRLT